MALVMLLDQMESRAGTDLVGELSAELNDRHRDGLVLPFTRTSGDEMQAVLGAGSLGAIVSRALRDGRWWIGIGIGPVERPLPADTREGRGPAFWNARKAIGRAKGRRRNSPVEVIGEDERGARLDQCLTALAFVINRRTPSQKKTALAYAESDGDVKTLAARLGISVQGARKNVLAAGCEEEAALRSLADWIADPATEADDLAG